MNKYIKYVLFALLVIIVFSSCVNRKARINTTSMNNPNFYNIWTTFCSNEQFKQPFYANDISYFKVRFNNSKKITVFKFNLKTNINDKESKVYSFDYINENLQYTSYMRTKTAVPEININYFFKRLDKINIDKVMKNIKVADIYTMTMYPENYFLNNSLVNEFKNVKTYIIDENGFDEYKNTLEINDSVIVLCLASMKKHSGITQESYKSIDKQFILIPY